MPRLGTQAVRHMGPSSILLIHDNLRQHQWDIILYPFMPFKSGTLELLWWIWSRCPSPFHSSLLFQILYLLSDFWCESDWQMQNNFGSQFRYLGDIWNLIYTGLEPQKWKRHSPSFYKVASAVPHSGSKLEPYPIFSKILTQKNKL